MINHSDCYFKMTLMWTRPRNGEITWLMRRLYSDYDIWRYERSSRLIRNLSNCEREAWKKFRLQRDSNPWPLRYRCSALPTELWSHNCWEQVNFSGSIMPLRVIQHYSDWVCNFLNFPTSHRATTVRTLTRRAQIIYDSADSLRDENEHLRLIFHKQTITVTNLVTPTITNKTNRMTNARTQKRKTNSQLFHCHTLGVLLRLLHGYWNLSISE